MAAVTLLALIAIGLCEAEAGLLAPLVFPSAVLLPVATVVWELRSLRIRRLAQQRRARVIAAAPNWDADPLAVQLAKNWRLPTLPPDRAEIPDLYRALPASQRDRAFVVCTGVADVPEPEDWRFEPEIIAPAHRWREIAPAAILVAALVVWLPFCCMGQVLADNVGDALVILVFLALVALLAGAYFLLRLAVRPEYIRLAPGLVQFVRYGLRSRTPRIESFPLTGGTLVLVDDEIRVFGRRLSFVLVRNGVQRELPVARLPSRVRLTERTWQALLSTAPTPPLSDEELVG